MIRQLLLAGCVVPLLAQVSVTATPVPSEIAKKVLGSKLTKSVGLWSVSVVNSSNVTVGITPPVSDTILPPVRMAH